MTANIKRQNHRASDDQIAELIERVEWTRDRWAGAEVDTTERQQARRDDIARALRDLDLAIWTRRRRGETVAEVRARLAPDVIW